MKYLIPALSIMFFLTSFYCKSNAQKPDNYKKNITKERLNGVYIPKDMLDACKELEALSDPGSLHVFKLSDEELAAKKLRFGLGKWIQKNWNLYDGSRFSYYLRQLGVTYPDDQVDFTIISFHRYLNNVDLELEERGKKLQKQRQNEYQEKMKRILEANNAQK